MMHASDVAIVPGDRDTVPSCCADCPTVGGAPPPINAGAFLQSPGFGGSHLIAGAPRGRIQAVASFDFMRQS